MNLKLPSGQKIIRVIATCIILTSLVLTATSHAPIEQSFLEWLTRCTGDAKNSLCGIVETAESIPLQLLFVFILGILMSFTPCIYPMIPITVGVIQANAEPTFWSHFKLSIAYTLGMAFTFAIFGLIAALSGAVFGQMLSSPFFTIFFVIVLAYLALSMFGLYEIAFPRFLQPRNSTQAKGSLLSSFLFGAASGTFASPCLSPGLALLLSMVATMGNNLLGFILLFVFGIGTSLPLLIVGTFSGTINMLPRAGMWMLEVKKIFGFMLIGMCFYYLNNILPSYITLGLLAITTVLAGIYYFWDISPADSALLKKLKNLLGFILIVGGILIGWQSFKEWATPISEKVSLFTTDYSQALTSAKAENKKLFLDFGAAYCTNCKYIEKRILKSEIVRSALESFVPVYIDGTNSKQEPFAGLREKYSILGFPTYLVINHNGELIQKWGSEIINLTPEAFAQELKETAAL